LAGAQELPVRVLELTDRQMLDIAMVSCEQVAGVPAIERAEGYARMLEYGDSVEEIAAKVGRGVSTIREVLKLRQLPELARKALAAGVLPPSTAGLIARVPGAEAREEVARYVVAGEDRIYACPPTPKAAQK